MGSRGFVVSRPYALFAAAVAAVAAPPLSYAPFLVDEPLAYPVSTLALLLIARAVAAADPPSRSALALVLCIVAPFVRGAARRVLLVLVAAAFTPVLWRTARVQPLARDVDGRRLGRAP